MLLVYASSGQPYDPFKSAVVGKMFSLYVAGFHGTKDHRVMIVDLTSAEATVTTRASTTCLVQLVRQFALSKEFCNLLVRALPSSRMQRVSRRLQQQRSLCECRSSQRHLPVWHQYLWLCLMLHCIRFPD